MKYSKVKIIWISVLQCGVNSCIEQINLFNYVEVPLVTCLKDWTWPVHYPKLHKLSLLQSKEEVSSTLHFFQVALFKPSFKRESLDTQFLTCHFIRVKFFSFPRKFGTAHSQYFTWLEGWVTHVPLTRRLVKSDVGSSNVTNLSNIDCHWTCLIPTVEFLQAWEQDTNYILKEVESLSCLVFHW